MRRQISNVLRQFIREEVYRNMFRTAGMFGGAEMGSRAYAGQPAPLWSPDEDENDEEHIRPYDIPDPELEDVVELDSDEFDDEPIIVQPGRRRVQ